MEYGINVRFFERTVGLRKAAELAAKAGFTQLDYTPPVGEDNWKAQMQDALILFNDLGLTVHQTHAPFNRYGSYGDLYGLCLARCAEATQWTGARFMVVHGDEFDFDHTVFSPDAALEYNHKLFLPYVEQGNNSGYKVAFETVFEDRPNKRRFTSDADELLTLIRSFGSESAVCCWDFGHSHVSFRKDAPNIVRKFGSLIQCTHLHDNTGNDSHQTPMTGDIDWKATMDAFREIRYCGNLCVEYAHGSIPEPLMEDYIELTYKTAKYIWETK